MARMTVRNPQRDQLAVVEQGELSAFAEAAGLVLLPSSITGEVIAVDKILQETIAKWLSGEAAVITGTERGTTLVQAMQLALAQRVQVIYSPSLRQMRHYYNLIGFRRATDQAFASLGSVEVVIPAGCYGTSHLFGVRRSS